MDFNIALTAQGHSGMNTGRLKLAHSGATERRTDRLRETERRTDRLKETERRTDRLRDDRGPGWVRGGGSVSSP